MNVPQAGPDTPAPAAQACPSPRLWNPNAAALWSLFFSPIFGAILHMKNWQAMGETVKAAEARQWVVGLSAAMGLLLLLTLFLPMSPAADLALQLAGLVLLLAWYYGTGKAQATRVLARYGRGYPRKSWVEPVLIGFAILAGLFVVTVGLGFLMDLIDTRQ
ncbi:hypothetical protein H5407_21350 [Mitsuaria sp. WAJ17]|uniref:hypothetical protein n=1 Tax=Mitsuaria sp. WAJ17 TaxID=2761452 RepID=UPI001603AFE3|nr:hypothetical protein [Mitsuaria sp. WAJ17]MBB2487791.1 hypothetical protein [Mitsuaria sp. WAJ17]